MSNRKDFRKMEMMDEPPAAEVEIRFSGVKFWELDRLT
jgi:hypothetical protein